MSTCFAHVKGLKCGISIDRKSDIVIITGVGHRPWRTECFPKMATFLFKRYIQEADSQFGAEDSTDNDKDEEREYRYVQSFVQTQTDICEVKSNLPIFTSTAIIQRPERTESQNSNAQNSTSTKCILIKIKSEFL